MTARALQSVTHCRLARPRSRYPHPMAAKAASPKILVVDDDVRLRDLLIPLPRPSRASRSRRSPDARDLDKKLQRDPPHLVVLDLMLPGEDGLAVCRRLRGAGEDGADHHADGEGRGRRPHRRSRDGRRRLSAEAVQSARARRAHPRRAAPPQANGSRPARRRPKARCAFGRYTLDLAARTLARRRDDDAPHDRRVLARQGVRAAPAPAARARKAHDARPRPRPRSVRPRDRRAGVAPAQAGRARSGQSALHPDGLGIRLRLRAG